MILCTASLLSIAIVPTSAAVSIETGVAIEVVAAPQECLHGGIAELCTQLVTELQDILCGAAGTCLVCLDFVPLGGKLPIGELDLVSSSPAHGMYLSWFGYGLDNTGALVPGEYQLRSSKSAGVC